MKKTWLMLMVVFTVSLLGCAKEEKYEVEDLPGDSSEDWGLELAIKDVTVSGGTFVFEQSGGNPTGQLETGQDYKLYVKENDEWLEMPYIVEDFAWDSIAYIIANDSTTELEVQWERLYGKLPPGIYAIEKEVMDYRNTGEYDEALYYAGFEIK